MRGVKAGLAAALAALCVGAAPASAAKSCQAPRGAWQRATPAEAGMDAAKLQDAMDYGTSQLSFAVRVYRRGCLVGEDRAAATNRNQTYESWSMAKSVTSLLFGRAMTLGLISPDDPVGALVPEADGPHGSITMRDLLTMTSGLRWNGLRDYNIFTMRDRVHDALTLEPVHRPGTYFEYAQSAVALLAEAVGRAVGRDAGDFVQRELMTPLGIAAGSWYWVRDPAGHVQGFYGVNMRPDDFGRLGELMRRGGLWRGRRLLSKRFVSEAVAPSPTNGCYAWLIWVNAAAPCVGPTISERPVKNSRDFPDLPADLYRFSGLFGQLVTVFPTQELVVVRTGQDPGLVFAGGSDWEHELYKRVLGAVTDEKITPPGPSPTGPPQPNADYGFQTSLREPDQYSKANDPDPLPPAGPERARATRLRLAAERVRPGGVVLARLSCPRRWLGKTLRRCSGTATLEGARSALRYDLAAGRGRLLRFRLTADRLRALRAARRATLRLATTNRDAAAGTAAGLVVTVRR
jgi:CubicO group peptidase (beta-lactamase class C family)